MQEKNKKAVNKIRRHSELDSESSTHDVSQRQQQRQAWKIPYQVRDDRPFYMNGNNGFTLIELLVVVLIIGILAAVALPQYQKAVEKSKAAQAQTMLKTVYNAAKAYELANGSWPTSFDELAVDIPWTGTSQWQAGAPAKSNEDWSVQLHTMSTPKSVSIGRISGKYAGIAFGMVAASSELPVDSLICIEGHSANSITWAYANNNSLGSYCQKMFKGTKLNLNHANQYFILP